MGKTEAIYMQCSLCSLMETLAGTKSIVAQTDWANCQLQNAIFQHCRHMLVMLCSYKSAPVEVLSPLLKCTAHHITAHSHCLVSIDVQQPLMNVTGCNIFHAEEFSGTLGSIHTSMSDTILSNCPAAAICCRVAKWNRMLVGRFILYCHTTTNIHLRCCGPTK